MPTSESWPHWRHALVFAAVMPVYDAIACLLAIALEIPYAEFAVGSYLLYAIAGFVARRALDWTGALAVAGAGGLSEATLGWAVSWMLGPGRWAALPDPVDLMIIPGYVIVVAGGCGAIGAVLGSLWPARRARAA